MGLGRRGADVGDSRRWRGAGVGDSRHWRGAGEGDSRRWRGAGVGGSRRWRGARVGGSLHWRRAGMGGVSARAVRFSTGLSCHSPRSKQSSKLLYCVICRINHDTKYGVREQMSN